MKLFTVLSGKRNRRKVIKNEGELRSSGERIKIEEEKRERKEKRLSKMLLMYCLKRLVGFSLYRCRQ
jgi:hypothetical protein